MDPKLVELKDVVKLHGLAFLLAVSWMTPQGMWPRVCTILSAVNAFRLSPDSGSTIEYIRHTLGNRIRGGSPKAIFARLVHEDLLFLLQLLRAHRSDGWEPRIRFVGRQHVEEGLRRGSGVVLWISHFVHSAVATKAAFKQAGFSVGHLSSPGHGFSSSRFGMRMLNPLQTRIEDRYIRERIMLSLGGPVGAIRHMRRRLSENGIVSISVRTTAQKPISVPFFDGSMRLASGAPDLAYATEACLLPVFTIRQGPGEFDVIVEAPLDLNSARSRKQSTDSAMRQYSGLLESHVEKYPGQWLGWLTP